VTLTEILIGCAILAGLMAGVYRLFSSSSRIMQAGMWATKAQNELRNTLTFLRDEIGRATPYTIVTESGVNPDPDPKYKLAYRASTIDRNTSGAILKFYQCRTATNLPGLNDAGGQVYCEVSLVPGQKGAKLVMKKELAGGSSPERVFPTRVLLEDVTAVKMSHTAAVSQEQMAQALLAISITVTDPSSPQRSISEETKAKVDTEVTTL